MSWVKDRIEKIATNAALAAMGAQSTARFQQNDSQASQGQMGQIVKIDDPGSNITAATATVALVNGLTVSDITLGNRWLAVGDITVVYGGVAH